MEKSDCVEVLTSVLSDTEAAMIVAALKEDDIDAVTEGELTANMRAEAPGMIRVLVRHSDMRRAKTVLDEFRRGKVDVDWSRVDIGEQEQ